MSQPHQVITDAPPTASRLRPGALHVDGEGEQHELTDALMPELAPGESVTHTPERWCSRCAQPRGGNQCAMCGAQTRVRGAGDVIEPPGDRVLGRPAVMLAAPVDDDGPELEPPELEPPAELASELEPPVRVRRGFGASSPGLERMRARAAELSEPEPEPAIVQRARGASAVTAAIHQQHEERPWTPLVGAAPVQHRRRPERMAPQPQQKTYDERGREVQSMGGHRRPQQSAEDQLVSFWMQAKVDHAIWAGFAAAAATRPDVETPEAAADFADQMYVAFLQRQNLAGQR